MQWTDRVEGIAKMDRGVCINIDDVIYNFIADDRSLCMYVYILDEASYSWEEVSNPEDEEFGNLRPGEESGCIHLFKAASFGEDVYVLAKVSIGGRLSCVVSRYNTRMAKWSPIEVTIPHLKEAIMTSIIGSSMYVFNDPEPCRMDVYRLDLNDLSWTLLACHGDVPRSSSYQQSATVIGERIYLFRRGASTMWSGLGSNDLVYLDSETLSWHSVAMPLPTRPLPHVRSGHTAINLGGKLLIFGGQTAGVRHLNDLWLFDPVKGTWSHERPLGLGPAPRTGHRMFQLRNRVVIFGGYYNADRGFGFSYKSLRDLVVLDTSCPSLRNLCIKVILESDLSIKDLPPPVRRKVKKEKKFRKEIFY